MGDRTYTSIEFSGEISREQADELIWHLDNQCCESNLGLGLTIEALIGGDSFYDHECNYATMDAVEEWCKANRVSFCKSWSQGGDYGPGIELYDHKTEKVINCAALESSPAVSLEELMLAHANDGVEALINKLKSLDNFSSNYPALKVFEIDDWPEDLCAFMAERALCEAS